MAEFVQELVNIAECHVFKIPPRQSAAGYKAEEWENCHIWTGKCRVLAKGEICEIRLEDATTNEPFAVCPINTADPKQKGVVEPVSDSSRYFVLKIEDGKGHHAFIGLGFDERSQAFDFNVAISDFKSSMQRQKQIAQGEELIHASNTDYSLKQGEKIKVDLKGKNKVDSKPQSAFAQSAGLTAPPSGAAGGLTSGTPGFAPPPAVGKKAAFKQKTTTTTAPTTTTATYSSPTTTTASSSVAPPRTNGPVDDGFDFLSSTTTGAKPSVLPQQQQASYAPKSADPFDDLFS